MRVIRSRVIEVALFERNSGVLQKPRKKTTSWQVFLRSGAARRGGRSYTEQRSIRSWCGGIGCAHGAECCITQKNDGDGQRDPQKIGMAFGEGARIGVIGSNFFRAKSLVGQHLLCLDVQGSGKVVLRRGCSEVAVDQAVGTTLRWMEEKEAQWHRQREANF